MNKSRNGYMLTIAIILLLLEAVIIFDAMTSPERATPFRSGINTGIVLTVAFRLLLKNL